MKDDPFSALGGLDQQLFKDEHPATREAKRPTPANERASERVHERTSEAGEPQTSEGVQPGAQPAASPAPELAQRIRPRPSSRLAERRSMRTPVSPRGGHHMPPRVETRHSHNLFLDQVRWINRMKLEVEEIFGEQITGNTTVQTAVDLLIEDYRRNGDDSIFIRRVVLGEPRSDPQEEGTQ